jgi:hypothetical protein
MDDIAQHPSGPPSSVGQAQDPSATVRLVPVTETFIVPAPWYKRVFGPVTRTETVWKLTFLSLMVVGVIVGQSMLNTPTNTVTQATVGKARVTLFPQSTQIPPEKPFQLWVTTDSTVKDAKLVLTFDATALKLNKDVVLIGKPGYQLSVTPQSLANKTGRIEILITPQEGASPIPAGTIQIGSLFFSSLKNAAVSSTTVSIHETDTTISDTGSIPFSLSTTNVTVTLK